MLVIRPPTIAFLGFVIASLSVAGSHWLDRDEPQSLVSSAVEGGLSNGSQHDLAGALTVDTGRLDGNGDMVLAGRALPGATVVIVGDPTTPQGVAADSHGEWVQVADLESPIVSKILTIRQTHQDEASEAQVLVIATGAERNGAAGVIAAARSVEGIVSILQPSHTTSAQIQWIEQDAAGRMVLGGCAESGGAWEVDMDGTPLGRAVSGTHGDWYLSTIAPAQGEHHFRLRRVGGHNHGAVVADITWRAWDRATLLGQSSQIAAVSAGWQVINTEPEGGSYRLFIADAGI